MSSELTYGLIGAGLILIVILFTMYGRKMYYVDINVFFELLKSTTYNEKNVRSPLYLLFSTKSKFETNCINSIPCTDKKGNCYNLINGPQIEVRITAKSKKRSLLYFDTLKLDGNYIVGNRSRFIPSLKKRIPISQITKVEIQDSGKKLNYD